MIHDGDNQKIPITIPQGGTVKLIDGRLDGNHLVFVEWEGRAVMMFTTDIRERGEPVDGI